ncbi:TetR/AcrR family transcriptional regulator [Leifsonia sp. F6_8S_P_1B]|uniref:TetR/AcrR family transcriptional regulator n=1 Tax=Leifsonia williamsii TaxID=3035919 RepID=A0ABT8KAC8_9MICO|nr:TetR/AcrR family transcriptional regulator [Leifsonia williamsii]MDN4614127.1 TetR/AcrR family transcriptional regulator [Leifsonia williamsii]
MPKISAPTVAEHRAAQRAALLRAAEALVHETGVAGVTPRAVAERAGLARSSFYEYFGSRDDVLAAVAIDAFQRWEAEVEAALEGVPAAGRLRAYVEATLRMTADGRHDIAATLQQAELSPSSYDDIMALHDTLLRPLTAVLEEAGVPDFDLHVALAQGLLNTGVRLVTHGADADAVAERIVGLLETGLPSSRR